MCLDLTDVEFLDDSSTESLLLSGDEYNQDFDSTNFEESQDEDDALNEIVRCICEMDEENGFMIQVSRLPEERGRDFRAQPVRGTSVFSSLCSRGQRCLTQRGVHGAHSPCARVVSARPSRGSSFQEPFGWVSVPSDGGPTLLLLVCIPVTCVSPSTGSRGHSPTGPQGQRADSSPCGQSSSERKGRQSSVCDASWDVWRCQLQK